MTTSLQWNLKANFFSTKFCPLCQPQSTTVQCLLPASGGQFMVPPPPKSPRTFPATEPALGRPWATAVASVQPRGSENKESQKTQVRDCPKKHYFGGCSLNPLRVVAARLVWVSSVQMTATPFVGLPHAAGKLSNRPPPKFSDRGNPFKTDRTKITKCNRDQHTS